MVVYSCWRKRYSMQFAVIGDTADVSNWCRTVLICMFILIKNEVRLGKLSSEKLEFAAQNCALASEILNPSNAKESDLLSGEVKVLFYTLIPVD